MTKYFEDVAIGEETDLGAYTFTAEEIVRFAKEYDPQPFHLSDEAARQTYFGRLAASGWHTAAIYMKLMSRHRIKLVDAAKARGETPALWGPSPGFRDLNWVKPVYAGDTISYRSRITEKKELRSKPELGLVAFLNEGRNASGEVIFSFLGQIFVERRKAGDRLEVRGDR